MIKKKPFESIVGRNMTYINQFPVTSGSFPVQIPNRNMIRNDKNIQRPSSEVIWLI